MNVARDNFLQIDDAIDDVQAQTESVTAAIRAIRLDIENLVKEIGYISEVSMQSSGNVQSVAASSEEQNAAMEEVAAASTHLAKWPLIYKNPFRHLNTDEVNPYVSTDMLYIGFSTQEEIVNIANT